MSEIRTGKVALGLALAGFVLFGASINDPFHFDDVLIINDTNVANPAQWAHFLNPLLLRQLTFFSFYLNHLFAADNPASYHLVNVLLHIGNSILLFALLAGWLDRRVALIASAVFLAHPIQTEAVMYVYQRSTVLACFFSLLALLAWHRDRRWAAAVLFFCAFESKEAALAVPLLLTWKSGRHLFVIVALVASLATGTLLVLDAQQEKTVGIGASDEIPALTYLLTESRVAYTYLRLLVFPYPQSIEYDFAVTRSINPQVAAQLIGLAAMFSIGVYLARSKAWHVEGFAIAAFFVLLAPTSSIIPSIDVAFEHRLYLPMLAFSVLVAAILARFPEPAWLAVPLVASLALGTLFRGNVWNNDILLWEDAVKHAPAKPRAWFNLGGAYMDSNPERAAAAYRKAIELKPDYGGAYYNLGVIDQVKKNYAPAVNAYKKAIRQEPAYWPAWNNFGISLMGIGEKERAKQAFQRTLKLNPDHWPARYNIALVDFDAGRFEQTIPLLRSVLEWRPDFRDARFLLAESLARSGHPQEAQQERAKISK